MGLDQFFFIKERVSEEERMGLIKSQYFYPLIQPKSMDDLDKFPIEEDLRGSNINKYLDALYLNIDKVWIVGDENLLSLDRPLYKHNEIGYFRKFNALQGYFEEYYNVENCIDLELSKDDLIKLKNNISPILKAYLKEKSNNKKTKGSFRGKKKYELLANELFPPSNGFFYGSELLDDYYFEDLTLLNSYLDDYINLIETMNPNEKLVYHCWY